MQLQSRVTNLVLLLTKHTAFHVSLPHCPSHLPACMDTGAHASREAVTAWTLFLPHQFGEQVQLCCSQAAPRVTTKVLAGHLVVGTEAPGILRGDSPIRTKHSTGINNICILAGCRNQHLLENMIQPHLAWTLDAGDLLLNGEWWTRSVPTAITSVLTAIARVSPWASLQQRVLSTEPKCRAQIRSSLLGVQPQLRHIWLSSLPQLHRDTQSLS